MVVILSKGKKNKNPKVMPSNSNFRRDRALEQKEAAKKATEAEKDRKDALEKNYADLNGVSRYIPRPNDNIDKWDKRKNIDHYNKLETEFNENCNDGFTEECGQLTRDMDTYKERIKNIEATESYHKKEEEKSRKHAEIDNLSKNEKVREYVYKQKFPLWYKSVVGARKPWHEDKYDNDIKNYIISHFEETANVAKVAPAEPATTEAPAESAPSPAAEAPAEADTEAAGGKRRTRKGKKSKKRRTRKGKKSKKRSAKKSRKNCRKSAKRRRR